MEMPGRKWQGTADAYRYGMNGQEKEKEIFGGANSAEHWMYDSRIGRRWELDPLHYDDQSPYSTYNDNPIRYSDQSGLKGDDVIATDTKTGKTTYHKDANGKDLIQHVEGTWNEDHTGFKATKTTKIEYATNKSAVTVNIDNSTRAGENPFSFNNKNYKPNSYQQGVYNSMNQMQKITAVSLSAPFVMQAFPAATLWGLRTAGIIALEEAAGIPNPESAIEKQVIGIVEKKVAKSYSEATLKSFQRQIQEHGTQSLIKTQSKIQKTLAEHVQKLAEIKKTGGYTSSVEREIRTFQGQLDAISQVLK